MTVRLTPRPLLALCAAAVLAASCANSTANTPPRVDDDVPDAVATHLEAVVSAQQSHIDATGAAAKDTAGLAPHMPDGKPVDQLTTHLFGPPLMPDGAWCALAIADDRTATYSYDSRHGRIRHGHCTEEL